MNNIGRHITEKVSFSAENKQARKLFKMLLLLIGKRSMRQKQPWMLYGSFLFAGPAIWRWRKYALFPRGGTGRICKDPQ